MVSPIRVLSVEDEESDAELLAIEMRRGGFEVSLKRVETYEEMSAALSKEKYDIVLADHSLPQFDSFSALSLLKEKGLDIPFIVVSAEICDDMAVKAMRLGAHDFIRKENLKRLVPSIERELREVETRRRLKEEEERVFRAEDRFRTLVENIHEVFWMTDLKDKKITYVSPLYEKIWGRSCKSLYKDSSSWLEAVYGEDRERIREASQTKQITGDYDEEFRIIRPDGSVRWLRSRAYPVRKGSTEVKHIVGISEDITERKEVEIALIESESRFSGIVSIAMDAIVMVNEKFQIILFNQGAEKIFGYPASEVLGKPLRLLIPDQFAGAHDKHVQTFLDGEEKSRQMGKRGQELFGKRRNGEVFPADISISKLVQHGKITFTAVLRDDTERKKAEGAVKRLNQELEQRVIRRTRQLKEANEDLRTFSYSVSHDLRAPLTVICGFSHLLLEDHSGKLDARGKEDLRRICDSSQRMEELIDDLLTLSRVTQSKISVDRVDLSAISDSIIAELRNRSPDRGVEWCNIGGVVVDGDVRLLRLVMENLLGNAWKYSGKKPRAKIEFGMTDYKGESVCYVRDNGAGFDMAYIDKLFSPLQRLHGQGEFPGNGIGLATVQRIINRHGGAIWGEGVVDQGAIFYFRI